MFAQNFCNESAIMLKNCRHICAKKVTLNRDMLNPPNISHERVDDDKLKVARNISQKVSESKSLNHKRVIRAKKVTESFIDEEAVIEPENVERNSSYTQFLCYDEDLYGVYEMQGLIGRGNFSSVFLALRKTDGRKMAMKRICKKKLNCLNAFVENEVKILRKTLHHNICQLYEAYETKLFYILLFEYLPNGDLFQLLTAHGTLNDRLSAKITAQVAEALNYLHYRSIVHRDVKPENLLLTSEYSVKLTDFGLACVARKPLFCVCGTPNYIAPEILKQTGYGVSVDIWSLGIMLHLMLVGRLPFTCSSRHKLFRMILNADFSFTEAAWNKISSGAKLLLSKMLIVDCSKRITAAQICADRWISASDMDFV